MIIISKYLENYEVKIRSIKSDLDTHTDTTGMRNDNFLILRFNYLLRRSKIFKLDISRTEQQQQEEVSIHLRTSLSKSLTNHNQHLYYLSKSTSF